MPYRVRDLRERIEKLFKVAPEKCTTYRKRTVVLDHCATGEYAGEQPDTCKRKDRSMQIVDHHTDARDGTQAGKYAAEFILRTVMEEK